MAFEILMYVYYMYHQLCYPALYTCNVINCRQVLTGVRTRRFHGVFQHLVNYSLTQPHLGYAPQCSAPQCAVHTVCSAPQCAVHNSAVLHSVQCTTVCSTPLCCAESAIAPQKVYPNSAA